MLPGFSCKFAAFGLLCRASPRHANCSRTSWHRRRWRRPKRYPETKIADCRLKLQSSKSAICNLQSKMEESYRQYVLEGERAGSRFALGVSRRLPQGRAGLHQGGRAGSSLEFKEHRDYQAGDDLRHIDWNAYARSDQLAVKVFHEEVNPHLDLVVDGSRSMALEG